MKSRSVSRSVSRWTGGNWKENLFGKRKTKKGRLKERASIRPGCELLEERTLLSVLPPPVITSHTDIIPNNVFFAGTHNTPSVAVDPTNPNNVAAVFTTVADPAKNPLYHLPVDDQTTFIQGSFSTNAGQTWTPFRLPSSFELTLRDPLEVPAPGDPDNSIEQATNASVAFDRSGNFYVVWAEHTVDNAVGDIRYAKFQFSGSAPIFVPAPNYPNGALYYWAAPSSAEADAALNPTIAIDTNLPFFQDPTTGAIQSDPYAGNVYIGWNTNNIQPGPPPPVPTDFNPNTVKLVASSDGGQSFTTQVYANTGDDPFVPGNPNFTTIINPTTGMGAQRDGAPRLVVSQGTPFNQSAVQASPAPTTTGFAGTPPLSPTDNAYNGFTLTFTSGANLGLAQQITTYTGANRFFTFASPWPNAPAASDTFTVTRSGTFNGQVVGAVPGGQLTVVWPDFGRDELRSTTLTGAAGEFFTTQNTNQTIVNAINPPTGNTAFTIPTLNSINVNITDPKFTTLTNLSVTVNIIHPNLSQLNVTLLAEAKLNKPYGLTFRNSDGNLFVSTFNNNSVVEYDGNTGALVTTFVASGLGGLSGPTGLAFGPNGDLFVLSSLNNEVLEYDGTTGAFVNVFVGPGSAGLSDPEDLVFQGGNLFVTSHTTNQVLEYNATTGTPVGSGIFVAMNSGGLSGPEGLVFGPDGNLYVSSLNNSSVLEYQGLTGPTPGAFIKAYVPSGFAGLASPEGLTFGQDGELYVTSGANNQVLRFTGPNPGPSISGSVQAVPPPSTTSFGGPATLSGTDSAYNGFTVTFTSGANYGQSKPVATYTGASHVFTFATAWAVAPAFGDTFSLNPTNPGSLLDNFVYALPNGFGLGGLQAPQGIAFGPGPVVGGNNFLFVVSKTTNSVMRYSALPGDPQPSPGNGGATFVSTGSGGLSNPDDLLLNNGRLLVSSVGNSSVLSYDPNTGAASPSAFVSQNSGGLQTPAGMAVHSINGSPLLFVGSQANAEVLRYDANTGTFVSQFVAAGQGGLIRPTNIAFGAGPDLYVTDSSANAVFRYDGATGASKPAPMQPGALFASGNGLTAPRALAFSPDNTHLFVTSFNGTVSQILEFDASSGAFISVFASSVAVGATPASPLNNPQGMFVFTDNNKVDNLYVTNSNNQILRYKLTTGQFMETIVPVNGVAANGAPWSGAAGIVVNPNNGMLYVSSTNNDSVMRYAGTPATENPSSTGGGAGADFTSPGGGATPIILLDNHLDAAGTNRGPGIGVNGGQNLGVFTSNGFIIGIVGTTFDDHVVRNINDTNAAAPYAEQFESNYFQLSGFVSGQTAAQLNGTWTLSVTDERPQSSPMSIVNWSLNFTSGMQVSNDKLVAGPPPPGGIQPAPLIGRANSDGSTIAVVNFTPVNPFPNQANTPVSPDRGIGPAPVIASDNTLGSFSPFQGRLYIAYVARLAPPPPNPLDNTDIFLSVSDDGGVSWSKAPLKVNDDSIFDGFSEGNRPQFQPNVAVDQATGTLVITFYDARNDAARSRVTTYIATSIDGGQTFAPQTYLNDSRTARDAITGQLKVLEPLPDNQGAGNAGRDTVFGFGDHQALAVSNGNIYSIWSGNENGPGLDIWTAKATIATGPRILSGTEGPVSGQKLFTSFAADGTQLADRFEVQFDRPVDLATFTTAQAQVVFRNTTTPAGSPPIPLNVNSVTAEDTGVFGPAQAAGATQFLVTFNPSKALTLGGTYTGTYSYTVGPNIADRIRTFNLTIGAGTPLPPSAYSPSQTVNPNLRVPPQDTGGDGAPGFPANPSTPFFPFGFDTRDTTFSPITISGVASNQLITNVTVTVNIQHTADSDLIIDLISPDGTIVVLSNKEPKPDFFAGSDSGFIGTTFDDSAGQSIKAGFDPFTGTFRPETPLGQFIGKIPNGTWYLAVDDTSQQDVGKLVSWTLNVSTGTSSTPVSLGNAMDQDGNAVRGENPGDLFIAPEPVNGTPFVLPYVSTTLPIIVPGPHLISTFVPGEPTTVDRSGTPTPNVENLVLNGTVNSIDIVFDRNMDPTTVTPASILRIIGPVGVIPGPFTISADSSPNYPRFINGVSTAAADPDPAHPRTYRITFPTQQLSGSYTVVLAPIMHAVPQGTQTVGDLLDTNLNAGLDVLRGVSPTNATVTAIAHSYSGPAVNLNPGKTTAIPLNFGPENFTIQGATLTLNITYPFDPDLEASLIAPDGTQIILFTKVGGGPGTNHANFTNTTLDDNAGTPIQSGTPPFNSNLAGAFNPQTPLSVLIGKAAAGIYTLLIKNDASTVSGTHTLNNWTLTLLERVPGTGLGEQVADQATAGFRIFTQNPLNVLSHTIWTAVGPASENNFYTQDPTFFSPSAELNLFTGQVAPEGGSSVSGNSGRVGGMALDPSDPSGNTVYIAGASGGVWKTTNFLTTDPNGPTYVPLTDFGPSFAINIGGLDVFGRNNDPTQSIVFAGTGEGDTGSKGVGIIRSTNGGATWTLLDSTKNVYDPSNDGGNQSLDGTPLPYNSPLRDHIFIGNSTFKLVVDPIHAPTSPNDVIVYVAMSGPNGGLWRSLDSGNHWQLMSSPGTQGTTATDVLLAPASASVSSGNLQRAYAAFEGSGVYMSLSQGTNLTLMTGGVGNALIRDGDFSPAISIPVANAGVNPNGANGRIALAMPALTGNPVQDLLYSGWLYAVVANTDGTMHGLFVTKDAGANWTQVHLPVRIIASSTGFVPEAIPTNDETTPDHNPLGGVAGLAPGQGNYDLSLAVDPNNPSIVYVGGTEDFVGQPAGGLLRVDTTGLWDPHALVAFDNNDAGAGPLETATTGAINIKDPKKVYGVIQQIGSFEILPTANTPYLNLISDPNNPFLTNSTILVTDVSQFNNQGSEVRFMHFDGDQGTTDQHRIISMKDPLTGRTRLIFGDDQGVYTVVDNGDGQFVNDIGGVASVIDPTTGLPILRGKAPVVTGSRNGNLQIIQFYYGAVQPSVLAAEVAAAIQGEGGMFYGNAQDDGFPVSDPHTLTNGDIRWIGPTGDGTGIATDQTGTGTAYSYQWPCCGILSSLAATNFFLVNDKGSGYISRTGTGGTSLVQANNPGVVPDPQWPFLAAGVGNGTTDVVQSNFAVNPINGNQIVIGSQAGRIFRSRDQGRTWGVIADPTALDGTMAPALAYGAPDPANPSQNLDDFILIGTAGGKVFVTLDGGGTNGKDWVDLTGAGATLGSAVMYISANPTRGSHEAYVVTNLGVFHLTFTVTYPTNAPPALANIKFDTLTGNIFNLTTNFTAPNNSLSFQLSHDSTKAFIKEEHPLQYLTALAVDWRYQIPNASGVGVHPALYVGGEGGAFRSMNVDNVKGVTWTVFPNIANDGSIVDGGYLPMAHITDLHISAGNINPTTGKPNQATGPNILVATTYGRGEFAIRLPNNSPFNPVSGPIVVSLLPTQPAGSSVSSVVVTFKTIDANGHILAEDPNSFTVASIASFTGPNGAITPTDVVDITPTPPTGSFTVQAAPPPTQASFAGPSTLSPVDNAYTGFSVTFTSGADSGFSRQITSYLGATRTFNFSSAWPIAPAAGDTFTFALNLHNVYRVDFPTQTAQGAYTIVIGPNVTDFAGNPMDQDADIGQPVIENPADTGSPDSGDTFTGRFYTNTTPTGPFVQGIVGHELGGGGLWVATSNGSNAFKSSFFGNLAPNATWVDVHTGDFNGDGKTDIAARNAQTGQWMVGISTGSTYSFSVWDTWSPAVTWVDVQFGNFDGSGKTSIAGRVLQSGEWWVAQSLGSSFHSTHWTTWSPAVTWVDVHSADFNGDGKTDIVGRVAQSGEWWVGLSTGTSFADSKWSTWSTAVRWVDVNVGDFNGDGKADIIGRVLQSGEWWTGISSGTSFNTAKWTTWSPNVSWVDVRVGDFNGDGKTDIVGRVAQSGEWWVGISSGTSFTDSMWAQWSPAVNWVNVIVGDFNGDGKTDIAGRDSAGEWWTGISTGSSFKTNLWDTWSPAANWTDVQPVNNV